MNTDMDIGLNLAEGVRVRVGDTVDELKENMEEHSIEYVIPYETTNGHNKEMIMLMEKCGVELNIVNDRIVFIKSNNTESNYIMQLQHGMSPIEALTTIRKNLAGSFNIDVASIRIDRFDGRSMDSMLSIPVSSSHKVKIELIMGVHQKIFMHSIALTE